MTSSLANNIINQQGEILFNILTVLDLHFNTALKVAQSESKVIKHEGHNFLQINSAGLNYLEVIKFLKAEHIN